MSGEKPSAEKPSGEAQSYYSTEPHAFKACKRMYALTLEQAAYVNWEQIHRYMCSRMKPVYALVCEHDGPDYPHIHCLYQYKNDKKISGDRLLGAHIETKLKSPQAYQAYCKGLDEKHAKLGVKSKTLIEEGELKRTGGARTIGDVKKMSRDEIDELPVQLNNVAEKIYEKERNLQGFFEFLDEIRARKVRKVNIVYAHGRPRSGKTMGGWLYATNKYENNKDIGRVSITNGFFKFENPDAKCFVIEEFRSSQLPANSWLQFTDKTGYSCPIKGGYQYCRPETIIVCSIINPQDLYSDEHAELKQQFIERITEFYEVTYEDGKRIWQRCKWNQEDRYWQDTDDEPIILDDIEVY